jgi:hypothetical protein
MRCLTHVFTTWTTSGGCRTYSARGGTSRRMMRRCIGRIISSKRIYKSMSKGAITTSFLNHMTKVAMVGAGDSTSLSLSDLEIGKPNKRSSIREDDFQFN